MKLKTVGAVTHTHTHTHTQVYIKNRIKEINITENVMLFAMHRNIRTIGDR